MEKDANCTKTLAVDMEDIAIKEDPIDDVRSPHVKEEPPGDNVFFPAATAVKEELDIGPTVLQRANYTSVPLPCKPEPGEDQPSETCSLKQQIVDRGQANDSYTLASHPKQKMLYQLSPKQTSANKKEPAEDEVRSPGATTVLKEEVAIRHTVSHRVYYNKNRRQASDSSTPTSHLEQKLLSELSPELTSAIKKEPPEYNIRSLDAATVVKEEMDIGPTEFQQMDSYYCLLPCKPEPDEDQASGSRPLEKQGLEDVIRRELTEISILKSANTYSSPLRNKSDTKKYCFKLNVSLRTGQTFYSCNLCSKRFFQKSNVINHLLSHQKSKLHTCSVCSKSFKWSSRLNLHIMSVHSVEKPHKCNVCSKSFKTSKGLKRHMATHSVEKPLNCNICSKSY